MNYNPPELDYKPIFLKSHILPTYIKPHKYYTKDLFRIRRLAMQLPALLSAPQ